MRLRSMTGFARVSETVDGIDVTLSIKSVNHRGLDMHFYSGPELDPFENLMRSAVKRHVARGHLDIRTQLTREGVSGTFAVDTARLQGYVSAYRLASDTYGLPYSLDLNAAFRVPGILKETMIFDLPPGFEVHLTHLLERVLGSLNASREREGGEIGVLLHERTAAVRLAAAEFEACRDRAIPAWQARTRERLRDLLSGYGIDPQRLAAEAALLADRSDIAEEIDRLRIHSGQVRELIQTGSTVGKELDFLLQEMNRETNTILSKTTGLGEAGVRITELAVLTKSDIEKMREQVLNLE